MASLRDIMIKVQKGPEAMRREREQEREQNRYEIAKSAILENYDTNTDIYFASRRIDDLAKTIVFESTNDKISKTISKLKGQVASIEEKLYNSHNNFNAMTSGYKRIMSSSIVESCNEIIDALSNRKYYDKFNNKEALGSLVADAQYFVKHYLNSNAVFNESINPVFNSYTKYEYEIVDGTIGG